MKKAMLLLVAMWLVGCAATVPVAPKVIDDTAKRFEVPAGQSVIYVARDATYKGKAILFQVGVDGRMLGGIASGTYFAETIPPGDHTVTALSNENQVSLKIVTEAGVAYFVRVEPRWGMVSAKVALTLTNPFDGRRIVSDSVMAAGLK